MTGLSVRQWNRGSLRRLPELPSGTYSVAWRDFLGIWREAPKNLSLPAQASLGSSMDALSN